MSHRASVGFRHEAYFYAGQDEFLAGMVPFVLDGVAAGEQVLVAVNEAKARHLRVEIGECGGLVSFVDMIEVGRNPACIIPVWQAFIADSTKSGARARGIGEPIWAERRADELIECHHHESLLNLAFRHGPSWSLACPYDTDALTDDVVAEARRTHPLVAEKGSVRASRSYLRPQLSSGPFSGDLSAAPSSAYEMGFGIESMRELRDLVFARATSAGLADDRAFDLTMAISELAANSVRHAGGAGTLRIWREDDRLVCEVSDDGQLSAEPLTGRRKPERDQVSGYGLWMVNQLCDLVQVRSLNGGTVVRAQMQLG